MARFMHKSGRKTKAFAIPGTSPVRVAYNRGEPSCSSARNGAVNILRHSCKRKLTMTLFIRRNNTAPETKRMEARTRQSPANANTWVDVGAPVLFSVELMV